MPNHANQSAYTEGYRTYRELYKRLQLPLAESPSA